jgi:hypothetical protein
VTIAPKRRADGIHHLVAQFPAATPARRALVSGWWTDERWTLEMVQAYLGDLAMTQAARGDRRVTLRKVTNASEQLAQIPNSDTQPVDIVLVGRPGLEVSDFAGFSGIFGNEREFGGSKSAGNSR